MIAIDCCVLSSALHANDSPLVNQRARALLDGLEKRGTKIALPAPAAFEFLSFPGIATPENVHLTLLRRFQVLPFDLSAISIATKIARSICRPRIVALYGTTYLPKEAEKVTHQRISVDMMILAIAEASGCEAIYTRDVAGFNGLRDAANLKVKVSEVPELPPAQLSLFSDISSS